MTYRHFEPKRGPNIFNGIHLNYSWKNFEFLAAVFNLLTIHETVNWYSVEDSYGVYPFGRSPFVTSSAFNGNVSSLGIIVLGLKQKTKKLTTQLWKYTAENVFNLALTQAEFQDSIRGHHLNFGIQGFFQNALDHGGNPDVLKAYILPEENPLV